MQHIRVLPYELVKERTQRNEDAMNAREVHWGGETNRGLLRQRGVSPVCGGAAVPASSPATACGGVVAQRFLRVHAACGERRASERERKSGDARKSGTLGGLLIGSAGACMLRISRARSVTPIRILCARPRRLRGNGCIVQRPHRGSRSGNGTGGYRRGNRGGNC